MISRLLFICMMGLCVGSSVAQMPNYMPAVNRAQSNFQFHQFMMSSLNRNYYNASVQKHTFKVIMADGNEQTVSGKIQADSPNHYLLWDDKSLKKKDSGYHKKIFPNQTKSIIRMDQNSEEYTGTASDSCWLFKAITGKINAYSPVADESLTADFLIFIQLADGPLLPLTDENLATMVKENEKAYGFLQKKKYRRAIEVYNKK